MAGIGRCPCFEQCERLPALGFVRICQQRLAATDHFGHQMSVHAEVGNTEALLTGLPGAQNVAGAAQLQVLLGEIEAVLALAHGIEPHLGGFADAAVEKQIALARKIATPDPATQLVQLSLIHI